MSNSKTFDEILFVVFVARKWKCKISRHGYDYHCSHARHGHHGHRDRQENQEIQDRQIWHLNLTFQVTCGGHLLQILRCFIQGLVWITRSNWEEREQLRNWSRLKYILIKKEANKALLRSTSKEEPKMLEWIPNKEHPYSPLGRASKNCFFYF